MARAILLFFIVILMALPAWGVTDPAESPPVEVDPRIEIEESLAEDSTDQITALDNPYFIPKQGDEARLLTADELALKLSAADAVNDDGAPRGGPPVNDNCANAIEVTSGSYAFSNIGATTDGFTETICNFGFSDGGAVNSDIWYRWQAPHRGRAVVSLCSSNYDTKMAIYKNICPTAPNQAYVCDEDSCGPAFQSTLTFNVFEDEYYLIRIGGFSGQQGTGTLSITSNPAPPNDTCEGAIMLGCEDTVIFDNTYATETPDEPPFGCRTNGAAQGFGSMWYKFVSPHGSVQLRTCDSPGGDTLIALYDGESGCPVSQLNELGCGEDECGPSPARLSTICIGNIVPGRTYFVQVASYSNATRGTIQLDLICPCPIGPDVVVGAIFGSGTNPNQPQWNVVRNWGRVGAQGITGYSVGTISCNPGDVPVSWSATNNKHPVIGQQLYRLKDGRFEQIGMSWVKHGFLALAENYCNLGCITPDPFDGTALGVGCSDPYNNELNGTTTRLGPRGHINAYTGSFPYPSNLVPFPPPGPPATIGRRLQVKDADLAPAQNVGARYFLEGHYATSDDATLGNGLNNASYREAFVTNPSGFTYNMTLTGPDYLLEPAINFWRSVDPDVVETVMDVPAEGRFILAAKATDLGGGMWNYEYALHNFNSDRSGRSFTVPVPQGVNVTNVGFHDVDYHSGDSIGTIAGTISNTDWTPTVGSGSVSWATQTFAQNQHANALRWATLYNYRFDADTPPEMGEVTVGLFKPGSPASISGMSVVPKAPNVVAPVDMFMTPSSQLRGPSDIVEVVLRVRSSAAAPVSITAVDAILSWNPDHLQFIEYDVSTAGYTWFHSGFLANPDGLNATLADGDGMFTVLAAPGSPASVPSLPNDLEVARFRFEAMPGTANTTVSFLPTFGQFSLTRVLGSTAGSDVTGDISSVAHVMILDTCSPTVGDVNGDQAFTFADIEAAVDVLLGVDTDPDHIIATDANCDGEVDGLDVQPLTDLYLLVLF